MKIVNLVFLFFCNAIFSQNLSREEVKEDLIEFLYNRKEISLERAEAYRNNEAVFYLRGVINMNKEEFLRDGMYTFSSLISHTRTYFILVDNDHYDILKLDDRKELDIALLRILDFCEEKRICVDIKNKYIQRIIDVYYNVNRLVDNEFDIDCYDYEEQKRNLP